MHVQSLDVNVKFVMWKRQRCSGLEWEQGPELVQGQQWQVKDDPVSGSQCPYSHTLLL